jgi:16S rRNA (cytosine967-C5)-methyltransferase
MKPENIEAIANNIFTEVSRWEYPADRILAKFFRDNRSFNSRNRRAIQAFVYDKIRAIPSYPDWMNKYVPENWQAEFAAMQGEAPVDLRVNSLKARREDIKLEGAEFTPHSAVGLRLQKRVLLAMDGKYEVQDEGSQLVVQYAKAKPGERVLDYCAGGGGKTLALAAEMQNKGEITAWDVDTNRMENLASRLERAGVEIAQINPPSGYYDLVFIDAPCSGSGTWRRNPDLKWRTKQADFEQLLEAQAQILAKAAKLVKKGGRLVYVTCSLFPAENEGQVERFLKASKEFKTAAKYLQLSPLKSNTDGFFAAFFTRTSS